MTYLRSWKQRLELHLILYLEIHHTKRRMIKRNRTVIEEVMGTLGVILILITKMNPLLMSRRNRHPNVQNVTTIIGYRNASNLGK
jgi:hypothetical protein